MDRERGELHAPVGAVTVDGFDQAKGAASFEIIDADPAGEHRFEPAGPAVANFLFVRVGDADALNDALLRRGVIVRPMRSFGAPDALRITAGTPEEVAFLGDALAAIDLPVGAAR